MKHYKPRKGPTHFAHRVTHTRAVGTSNELTSASDDLDSDNDSLHRHLKDAAEVVADGVRREVSPISRRTAASVHVEQDSNGHTSVVAGGETAPMGPQFENEGSRHPVFPKGPRDSWHWGPQPWRPFMQEGADSVADQAADVFSGYLDDLTEGIGSDRP